MTALRPNDIGYLKRVDRADGWSDLIDGFGNVAAQVRTDAMPEWSRDGRVYRFRLTETEPV